MTYSPSPSPAPGARAGWLTTTAVTAAVALSGAVGGVGVVVTFAPGVAAGDPWSIGASVGGVALVALTEVGAVLALLHGQRRFAEGHRKVGAAALALFAALTCANVTAGHYGARALNDRLVSAQRAPLEAAAAAASTAHDQALAAQAAFTPRASADAAALEASLAAERSAASQAVTARARAAAAAREALAARQASEREALAAAVVDAAAAAVAADAALGGAPVGFSEPQLWGFAGVLELLKGVLAWVAVPRRRRQDPTGGVVTIAPGDARLLTDEELTREATRARSWAATLQHEARRRRAA